MELLSTEQFRQVLRRVERSAFHFESRDDYHVANEDAPFSRWMNGEPDDYVWFHSWLDLVRGLTVSGRRVSRLRVVTHPHTKYIEWEMEMTRFNIEAGEDVRWLPRHLLPAVELPPDDFWLLDDGLLIFNRFDAEGRAADSEVVTDPTMIGAARMVRDRLWSLAVPHAEYAT